MDSISLTENIERLGAIITPKQAAAFQAYSDKMGDTDIEMNKIIDRDARISLLKPFIWV